MLHNDPVLGRDKPAHYLLHFWLFIIVQLFIPTFWAIALTTAFGVLWEVKDKYAKPCVLDTPIIVKLFGTAFNVGGYGVFSVGDIIANAAGMLTGVWFCAR